MPLLYRFRCPDHTELIPDPAFTLIEPEDPAGRWQVTLDDATCPTGGTSCQPVWEIATCPHRVNATTHSCLDEICWNYAEPE